MKRTYSVADLKVTCVIDCIRANEIEGNFLFFDWPTGPSQEVLPVVFASMDVVFFICCKAR